MQVGHHVLEQTCIPFATATLQRTAYQDWSYNRLWFQTNLVYTPVSETVIT